LFYLLNIAAVLPGLIICYLIFRIDRYEREPLWAILLAFVLGVFATVPAVVVQYASGITPVPQQPDVLFTIGASFGVVAISEEVFKCLVFYLGIFRRRFFNEPLDGIVYAVILAMGYATIENMLYAAAYGINTTILRAFTAIPAHLVFAIVQGYYLGRAKFTPGRKWYLIAKGLGIAIILHGSYDFLVMQQLSGGLSMLGAISVYICLYYCEPLIREHLESSPFRS
jgi:RsiW-degrading membrane proteinase PrsW (M82 family)